MLYVRSPFHSLKRRLNGIRRDLPVSATLLLAGSLIAGTALAMHLGTRPVSSTPSGNVPPPVTGHAAGRAGAFFYFQDGPPISADFSGAAAQALQSGQAQARALASGDLDGNGTPDVIAGYGFGGTGIVTIQRGNPDAFAPHDTSVYGRMQNGYNPEALLPGVETITI